MRLRLRLGSPIALTSAAVFALLMLVAVAFAPAIRSIASARAARRQLRLRVGSIQPCWAGVYMTGVDIESPAMPDVHVHVDALRLSLSWNFKLRAVDVSGLSLRALGSESRLRDEWDGWRKANAAAPSTGDGGHLPDLSIREANLRWDEEADSAEPRFEAVGVTATVAADAASLGLAEGHLRAGPLRLGIAHAEVTGDREAHLRSARIESMTLEGPTRSTHGAMQTADESSAPGRISLLELGSWRTRLRLLAALAGDRMAPDSEARVDAFTWKVTRETDQVALTIGPGPAVVARSPSELSARFTAEAAFSATPLAIKLSLPLATGDATVLLDGGPVSLSALGVRNGALGLVDVGGATLSGRASMVLASDGASLTFDAEGGAHGLAVQNERLAPDIVRAPDFRFRLRGLLTSDGQLRLDDVGARMGALEVTASGLLEQTPDHVNGAFRFEAAPASCQALQSSIPSALLPDLAGTEFAGTYGLKGRLTFDSRSLDDLVLEYDSADRCRVVAVPSWLAREQFDTAFTHRIVLPDGSLGEMMTGPGTSNWTPLDEISPYMQVAVLTTEDGGFWRHHGFNRASIRASLIANLKAGKFLRGASTITMQLAKNLFLSRNKTLSRKLEEVVLTEYLEQAFAKNELMELYLNVIEFGPAIYGITAAADHYFGRTPEELDLSECLFLATLLPSPRRLAAVREKGTLPDPWARGLHTLMRAAHKAGRISDEELATGEAETVVFWTGGDRPPPRQRILARPRLDGDNDETSEPPMLRDGP